MPGWFNRPCGGTGRHDLGGGLRTPGMSCDAEISVRHALNLTNGRASNEYGEFQGAA